MDFFVTAIGTDCGKTLVSAVLCEAFQADYWKPVQAGYPTDASTIRSLVTNPVTVIHPEKYCLQQPASPHAAAALEGLTIRRSDFRRPNTKNHLVIEGAGGVLVPLNDRDFVIDIAIDLDVPIVLVSNLYLGSINHTLLTSEALKTRSLTVAGIIFNGEPNPQSERIILLQTGLRKLGHIPRLQKVDKEIIQYYAAEIRRTWHEQFAE